MIRYEREENGVTISLMIDNESYTTSEVVEIIEKINTTVEVKELKSDNTSPYSKYADLALDKKDN